MHFPTLPTFKTNQVTDLHWCFDVDTEKKSVSMSTEIALKFSMSPLYGACIVTLVFVASQNGAFAELPKSMLIYISITFEFPMTAKKHRCLQSELHSKTLIGSDSQPRFNRALREKVNQKSSKSLWTANEWIISRIRWSTCMRWRSMVRNWLSQNTRFDTSYGNRRGTCSY